MKIPSAVVDELITGSQSDIRQVLTMLSTWKLSRNDMDFDEGKDLYVAFMLSTRNLIRGTGSVPMRSIRS